MFDMGDYIVNFGDWRLDVEYLMFDIEYWILDIGDWICGIWSFGTRQCVFEMGYDRLAIVYSVLDIVCVLFDIV